MSDSEGPMHIAMANRNATDMRPIRERIATVNDDNGMCLAYIWNVLGFCACSFN